MFCEKRVDLDWRLRAGILRCVERAAERRIPQFDSPSRDGQETLLPVWKTTHLWAGANLICSKALALSAQVLGSAHLIRTHGGALRSITGQLERVLCLDYEYQASIEMNPSERNRPERRAKVESDFAQRR